jgi:hypothetical protein
MEGNVAANGACGWTLGFDEKSLIENWSCPSIESRNVASPTPNYFHRRKGCGGGPLRFDGHQTSYFWATVDVPRTSQFEEPRTVRCNCGIKWRFPSNPCFFFPVCSILVQLCIKCTNLVLGNRFMGGAGDESDDYLPKLICVKSIASV